MHAAPTLALPSELRTNRLHKWLSLWLVWFVAHLFAHIAPDHAAALLAKARRRTKVILITHALRRVALPRLPARPRCYDPARPCRFLSNRIVVGHALNRATKARGLIAQAQRLYAVLANPARWIARIVRRLNRRFSKLRPTPRFARVTQLVSVARPDACAINSS